jgi:hypothetical protein
MSDSRPKPAQPRATPRITAVPLRCLDCGYPMVGISPDGVCPECGLSIPRMRGHEPLDALPPALLRCMRSGLTIILAALACKVLLYLLPNLLGSEPLSRARHAVMKSSGARISPGEPVAGDLLTASLLYSVAFLLVGAFSLFGYIRFTTPENAPYIIGLRDLNRRVSRIAAIVEFAAAAVIAATLFVPGLAGFHPLANLVWFVAIATWFGAHFAHVARLARRAGHESLATLCLRIRWIVPLVLAIGFSLFMLGGSIGGWIGDRVLPTVAIVLVVVLGPGLHTFVLWRTRSLLTQAIAVKAGEDPARPNPAETDRHRA